MYWVNTMARKPSYIKPTSKSQGLVPAHFTLIIIIVVHVVKHQSVINKYMQKAGEPENDAGFESTLIRSHERCWLI